MPFISTTLYVDLISLKKNPTSAQGWTAPYLWSRFRHQKRDGGLPSAEKRWQKVRLYVSWEDETGSLISVPGDASNLCM